MQSGTPLWRSAAFPRLIHDQKERTELSHDFPSPNFVHQAIKNADASLSQAQHCHGMRMWKLAATIPRGPHSSRKTGRLLPPSSSFHSFHTFNPSNILEQAQMPCNTSVVDLMPHHGTCCAQNTSNWVCDHARGTRII